jgi:hypothetical protein
MIALQPGRERGYRSQLYGPFRALYAKMAEFDHKALRRLIVPCTWGASLSHSWREKVVLVVANIDMNASLKVWMAHLAAFTQRLWGSTSCNLHSFLVRNCLMYLVV